MQLKSQVEWALHCCAILAGLPANRYLATKALAELHGVPKEYLSKALQGLSQAGIIQGTLGPTGGYRLARAATDITFLDIVQAVEGHGSTFVCTQIRQNNPCRPKDHCEQKSCAVARVMWEADRAWRDKLASVPLSEVVATLSIEVDPDIWKHTFEWVLDRAG